MAFQQGLSGLLASQTSLNVIGNNVANASTVGFKESRAEFADVYARALNGGSASQVGIGTSVSRIQQMFSQGNITTTNNVLDIAINGSGFYRLVDNSGAVSYTRNGQFILNEDGYLETGFGNYLTGYPVVNGVLAKGGAQPIHLNMADIPPKVTTDVTALVNLDSRQTVPTVAPFDPNNPLTYNEGTAINVYDSLGNMRIMQMYFVRTVEGDPTATPVTLSEWEVYVTSDGTLVDNFTPPAPPVPVGTLSFDGAGQLSGASALAAFDLPALNGSNPLTIDLDFAGSSQYGSKFGVNALNQNGYSSGRLDGYSIDKSGMILGSYTNGQAMVLGQIVLANFANPTGLEIVGNNQWVETLASGPALVGEPGTGGFGNLRSYATEDSNVDLTAELINMIIAQRVYQANAQTIKTEDQIMQTLVNLR